MDESILAFIPAWNEGARIGPVIGETLAHLPVLVVDDGSRDNTFAVAKAAGAVVLQHEQNQGKGAALQTGFDWALAHGYEAVLTLDADGQHDPADIPAFLAAYEAGAGELIIGRRDFGRMPFPRRWVNPFGSWLLSQALDTRIYDNQSGFRLHTSSFLRGLTLERTGFELEVEIIVQAIRQEVSIGWVDIRTIYGIGKRSNFRPIADSVHFLRTVWWAYRQRLAWENE